MDHFQLELFLKSAFKYIDDLNGVTVKCYTSVPEFEEFEDELDFKIIVEIGTNVDLTSQIGIININSVEYHYLKKTIADFRVGDKFLAIDMSVLDGEYGAASDINTKFAFPYDYIRKFIPWDHTYGYIYFINTINAIVNKPKNVTYILENTGSQGCTAMTPPPPPGPSILGSLPNPISATLEEKDYIKLEHVLWHPKRNNVSMGDITMRTLYYRPDAHLLEVFKNSAYKYFEIDINSSASIHKVMIDGVERDALKSFSIYDIVPINTIEINRLRN
jgi:hypothetical protein